MELEYIETLNNSLRLQDETLKKKRQANKKYMSFSVTPQSEKVRIGFCIKKQKSKI